jgi:hypothetical protein
MAVLAVAVAGAAIGSTFGYATIGWTVGAVAGQLLFPGSVPDQFGPRVGDLRAQQSSYGAAIPILYGTTRVAGNVIWSTPLIETATTSESGGKGGGGGQTQTTYSYRVSMAVMLGEGEVLSIRRIWADGRLVYNIGSAASISTVSASRLIAPGIVFYRGTETQLPDEIMEAYLGVGNVPAYRGRAYLLFSDMPLEDYGNRRPNITVELVAAGGFSNVVNYAPNAVPGTQSGGIETDGTNFVMTVYDGMAIVRSTDGINWSARVKLPGTFVNAWGVDYEGGQWLVGGTNCVWTSPDAYTWTRRTSFRRVSRFAWNGSVYVGVSENGIMRSTDNAVTWNDVPIGTSGWIAVRWFNDRFIAISILGATATSPDGLAWVIGAIGFGGQWTGLATNGTNLVAVQGTGSSATSPDGLVWTARTSPGAFAVEWSGTEYIACRGTITNALIRSPDGVAWTGVSQPQNYTFSGLAVAGSAVVCAPDTLASQRHAVFRLDSLNVSTVPLSSIVSNICTRAGLQLADIDVTALTDPVDGYAIGRQMTARAAIEPLQRAFYFDAIESAGKIAFRKRGGAPVAAIAADDLAAASAGDALPDDLSMARQQEVELPAVVSVVYIDRDADYQQNTQQAQRITTLARQQTGVELAIVMSADRARAIAETLMYDAWTQRNRYTFQTAREYAALEPADVVTIVRNGTTHTLRLQSKTESRSGVIRWEAVAEEASVYTQAATGGAGPADQEVVASTPQTLFFPLDAPALRDQDGDAAFYGAASGIEGWRGSVLYRSADGGATYDEVGAMTTSAAVGRSYESFWFNGGHPNTFDETSRVAVELFTGTLSSLPMNAVLEGGNYIMIGSEIIQFRSANMFSANNYELTGLLRGRRGTEWAMTTHAAVETAVVLNASALRRFPAELSSARLYKPVSIGRNIQETSARPFTYTGVNQIPFAPVSLGGGRSAANDLTINWRRRSRQGLSLPWNYDPPLGEVSELYDVEVWNTAFTVLRRTFASVATTTVTYTAAQQTTDGGVLSSYGVRVFQRSAVMARGYALQGIL